MTAPIQTSPALDACLRKTLIARAHPLLLRFDANWQLSASEGDADFHALDLAPDGAGVQELQALLTGLALDQDHDIPFVELSSGRSVHVHSIATSDGFDILLLDAEEARARERNQQQLGNEAALASQQKSWAIGKLKDIRSELERQRETLEEANALKNALIATLGHEFRTPLTSIFGYLHLIEHRDAPSQQDRAALHAIRRNATWLFALAENLLEYARDERAPALINPSDVDLHALLADLDAMFRPLAADKGLHFVGHVALDDASSARVDALRLRQILINLLSNAVRYSDTGEVGVALELHAGVLTIDVRDSGVGIPLEYRERVFKPFNRGGPHGRKGAGLGLSIVRRLVAQMHGTLVLESTLGEGSHFRIELPVAPRASDTAPQPSAPRHRRVLIVDDDRDIAQLLAALLGDNDLEVACVGDAQTALERVAECAPDVLLIDVQLPGLSGNAAVFHLRARGYQGCIVTLSARADREARDAALRAGADHYLTKPLDIERFVGIMQSADPRAATAPR